MTIPFPPDLFRLPVVELARRLVGALLLVDGVGGRIVETEAYHPDEPAAHSHRGPTPRTATMFGPVGRLYVYRSYGLHWCVNIVGGERPGAAVLLRALAPIAGLPRMAARRGLDDPRLLCAGPGRLAQALGITAAHDGVVVGGGAVQLLIDAASAPDLLVGPRIGITKAAELPWRFGLAGSRYLSRAFPRGQAAAGASPAVPANRSSPRE